MGIQALAGGKVLAEKFGDKPAKVIALHGWGRSGADFAQILNGLSGFAIHLPGFGPAAAPDSVWGTSEYAELVAEAIEPFAPVVLVGHSFGGRIAVRIAANRPELVSGLVLTGAPVVRLSAKTKPSLAYRIARFLNRVGLVSDKALEKRRRKTGSADYLAAQGIMRDIMVKTVNEDYETDLAKIKVPTWLVWGENDTAAPTAAGKVASEKITGSKWVMVQGEGHLLTKKLGAAVREAIVEAAK